MKTIIPNEIVCLVCAGKCVAEVKPFHKKIYCGFCNNTGVNYFVFGKLGRAELELAAIKFELEHVR